MTPLHFLQKQSSYHCNFSSSANCNTRVPEPRVNGHWMLRKKEMLKRLLYTFTAKKNYGWVATQCAIPVLQKSYSNYLPRLIQNQFHYSSALWLGTQLGTLGTQHAQHGTLCSLQPRCKRRRQRLHSVQCKWRQTAWLQWGTVQNPCLALRAPRTLRQCFMGSLLQLQAELQVTHFNKYRKTLTKFKAVSAYFTTRIIKHTAHLGLFLSATAYKSQ